nr:MAG TPA: hypothetical protein [Caudoviricetes sp.]
MALETPTRFLSYNERGISIGKQSFLLNMLILSLILADSFFLIII